MNNKNIPGRLMRANEVQRKMGCGRTTVYKIMARKDFPKIKINGRIYVPENLFNDWLRLNLWKDIRA